ncbi:Uncharacterised protein [Candidatus Tiddalikarchaeum anstoanum]|nr:Uncharacterised protein [Candidatus Tiddalikarchaeum anstoanum]
MVDYKRIIHYSLLALTITYLITGLIVTEYRIVEPLTFGLLSKAVSMQIHEGLIYLFIPVLFLHLYFKRRIKSKV